MNTKSDAINNEKSLAELLHQHKEVQSSAKALAQRLAIETVTPLMEEFKIENIDVLVGNADHLQFEVKPFSICDRSFTFDPVEGIPETDEEEFHRDGLGMSKKEFALFKEKLFECEKRLSKAFRGSLPEGSMFSSVFDWDREGFDDLVSVVVREQPKPNKSNRSQKPR